MTTIDNGLWKAADVINDLGFVKGKVKSNTGAVCALGALGEAHNLKTTDTSEIVDCMKANYSKEYDVLVGTIRTLFPDRATAGYHNIVHSFNDNANTTKADVQKVLRVAGVTLATS